MWSDSPGALDPALSVIAPSSLQFPHLHNGHVLYQCSSNYFCFCGWPKTLLKNAAQFSQSVPKSRSVEPKAVPPTPASSGSLSGSMDFWGSSEHSLSTTVPGIEVLLALATSQLWLLGSGARLTNRPTHPGLRKLWECKIFNLKSAKSQATWAELVILAMANLNHCSAPWGRAKPCIPRPAGQAGTQCSQEQGTHQTWRTSFTQSCDTTLGQNDILKSWWNFLPPVLFALSAIPSWTSMGSGEGQCGRKSEKAWSSSKANPSNLQAHGLWALKCGECEGPSL